MDPTVRRGLQLTPIVVGGLPHPPDPPQFPLPPRRSSWPRVITCSSRTRGRTTAVMRVGAAGAWPLGGCGLGGVAQMGVVNYVKGAWSHGAAIFDNQ